MQETTEATFEKDSKQGVVILKFWAEWCNPCKQLMPVVESVSKEMPSAKFLKVNVDNNPNLARMFGIRGVPVLVFMKNGNEVSRTVGVQSSTEIKSRVTQILK